MDKVFIILIIVNLVLFHKMFITIYSNVGFGLLREVVWAAIAAIIEIALFMMAMNTVGPILLSIGMIILKILIVIAGIILFCYVLKQIFGFINKVKKHNSNTKRRNNTETKEQQTPEKIDVTNDILDNDIDNNRVEIKEQIDKKEQVLQEDLEESIKDYVFCVFCGKKISRDAKFCNYCGEKNEYVK